MLFYLYNLYDSKYLTVAVVPFTTLFNHIKFLSNFL